MGFRFWSAKGEDCTSCAPYGGAGRLPACVPGHKSGAFGRLLAEVRRQVKSRLAFMSLHSATTETDTPGS